MKIAFSKIKIRLTFITLLALGKEGLFLFSERRKIRDH